MLGKRIKRVAVAFLATVAILGGVLFATAAPAQAAPACTPSGAWTAAGDWGQIRWCSNIGADYSVYVGVQIQDIKTDGHGVHAETGFLGSNPYWYGDNWQDSGASCGSSGSVNTCYYTLPGPAGNGTVHGLVRAVLGSPGSHYEYGWTWWSF